MEGCEALISIIDRFLYTRRHAPSCCARLNGADLAPALIPVAVSARHVHLTPLSISRLFGEQYELRNRHALLQPDQFAAEETVSLIGPAGRLDHVRVIGPPREHDQVEVSRTDAILLGVAAPVRESGDIAATPGIRLQGPHGSVLLERGVICSLRHIHMTPTDAAVLGLADKDSVQVTVMAGERRLTFADVRVRVSPSYRMEFHIDTDEANAAGLQGHEEVLVSAAIGKNEP